jgi:hypothetical protein
VAGEAQNRGIADGDEARRRGLREGDLDFRRGAREMRADPIQDGRLLGRKRAADRHTAAAHSASASATSGIA